ncbi:MAG TPA: TolC family protein, partial [Candidatus Cloacimonadota bacterium]|nr:TolC family protein [Candidatus Cloacimonadota bacterium]
MTDLLELEKTLYSKRQDLFQMLNTEDLGYEFEDIELSNTDSIENDFTDNNAIKISENKLKQNKLNITSSQLSLYPNIYFGYAYRVGVTDKEANPIFKPKEYDDSYTYGVYFSYPLFSFLDKGSVHSVQKKQSKMLEINHKDLTSQQKVKYQQSINEFNIYKQSYEIYKQKLALSTTHLEIAQKRFEMGLINILDLDKSRIQYLEAQLSMN